jgi:uncharacterized membrane protein
MATTAWRFANTEGADEAVLKLQDLGSHELIEVHDAAVIRWPQYAAKPTVQAHVNRQGGKASALLHKVRHGTIEGSLLDSVTGAMTPGTSALVLRSSGAAIGQVAQAFRGQNMQLIHSDLPVREQDQIRSAFGDTPGTGQTGPLSDAAGTFGGAFRLTASTPVQTTTAPATWIRVGRSPSTM